MLTDAEIKAAKSKDRSHKLSDSGQLYLLVTPAGGRYWRRNYVNAKYSKDAPAQKTLALGSYPSMTLSEARARRDEAKSQLMDGLDPAMQRHLSLRATRDSQQNTSESMARKWHAQRQSTWSKVHAADVLHSLERDVFPAIGGWTLADITAPVLLDVLERVEKRGAVETAHRLRQRISDVFVYALAIGAAESNSAASLSKAPKRKPRAKPQAITDLAELKRMMLACDAQLCRATTSSR